MHSYLNTPYLLILIPIVLLIAEYLSRKIDK